MDHVKSKKRKGYGAQSAVERKNRRKAFKINSKERDAVITESTSCLLTVPGPKEKQIRWKKENRDVNKSKRQNKNDHIERNLGRTSSTLNSPNNIKESTRSSMNDGESSSSSQIPSPVYSGINPKRPLPKKKRSSSVKDFQFNGEQPFHPSDQDSINDSVDDDYDDEASSNGSIIESFTSDDSVIKNSTTENKKNRIEHGTSNNHKGKYPSRNDDIQSNDHSSSFLTDYSQTSNNNIFNPPGLKRISNWRNKKGQNHKNNDNPNNPNTIRNIPTVRTESSTQQSIINQNDPSNESMDNESVDSAISNESESEFQLVSNRTPHRRHDIIEECYADQAIGHIDESKMLPLCESKLLSGLSSEIEQQRENESSSHMFNELTNSTSSTKQHNEGLFVEPLKKMIDTCNQCINSESTLISTTANESFFIILEQSIIQVFQEMIQIKEQIMSTNDPQIALRTFHQSFENSVKIYGVNNIVLALTRNLKFMLRREMSILTISSFSHCIRFFLNTISYDDFYYRLDGTNSRNTTFLSHTMMKTILDTEVITCILGIIPFCVDFISKKNTDVINSRNVTSSALYCIQEALGSLHAVNITKLSRLLLKSQGSKGLWDSFMNLFRTATMMPTYASLEVLLLFIFRVRLNIYEVGHKSVDDNGTMRAAKSCFERLNSGLRDIFRDGACPREIIIATSSRNILLQNMDQITSVDPLSYNKKDACDFVEWVRESFKKVQLFPETHIRSFQCNGICKYPQIFMHSFQIVYIFCEDLNDTSFRIT